VVNRLVAGGQVDDPQTLDATADRTLDVYPARIGATVLEPGTQRMDRLDGDRTSVVASLTSYAAHRRLSVRASEITVIGPARSPSGEAADRPSAASARSEQSPCNPRR